MPKKTYIMHGSDIVYYDDNGVQHIIYDYETNVEKNRQLLEGYTDLTPKMKSTKINKEQNTEDNISKEPKDEIKSKSALSQIKDYLSESIKPKKKEISVELSPNDKKIQMLEQEKRKLQDENNLVDPTAKTLSTGKSKQNEIRIEEIDRELENLKNLNK